MSHFIKSFIDWLFRKRSPALLIMSMGMVGIGSAVSAGLIIDIYIPYDKSVFSFSINNGGGTPVFITYCTFGLSIILVIVGLIWEILRYIDEQKTLLRKKIIVIESRGLRDTSGSPLSDALPKKLKGHKEIILLDTREHIKDGLILHPEAALSKITLLPQHFRQKENGLDRSDITVVYGGLAPVPFTFLTGVLVDDENSVMVFDWERHKENWQPLSAKDDYKRFIRSGFGEISTGTSEVALAVSVSYRVDLEGIKATINDIPFVHMELEDGHPNCHWAEEKQQALGEEFLNTIIGLANKGVKRIHLFCAAQNSIVFRFGRLCDKRNFPEIVVYQYQKGKTPPYPWGILMPLGGNTNPTIRTPCS